MTCARSRLRMPTWALFRFILGAMLSAVALAPALATTIERVVSPLGIEAWLVREPMVPLIAVNFAFRGGANEDPTGKPGVAHFTASVVDEGAGELDSKAFHERLEARAIELAFSAGRDQFFGSLRTLAVNRDVAFELLRLALTAPRFDSESVERVRRQIFAELRRETTNPNDIANRLWWDTAFAGHPYGRPVNGSLESLARISTDDLKAYTQRVFARRHLKIAIVGDVDAATVASLLDRVFGALPEAPELRAVADSSPQGLGRRVVADLDVPQTVIMFGGPGIARNDPDFITAYIVNHILGGGVFSSRLYREVREKRGLVYGISTGLTTLAHTALLTGGTATRGERAGETLEIAEREIRQLAESGPSEEEVAKAKSFLQGSYALNFDSSSKIANQLVQIQIEQLGIDYIERRKQLIDAVTLGDTKRVAKRLLDPGLLVTVVGRPQGVVEKDHGG
jgi:zinc protease